MMTTLTETETNEPDVFKYAKLSVDDREKQLNELLEQREKTLWDVQMRIALVDGLDADGDETLIKELASLKKMEPMLIYGINQLRALKASLS